ncbi:MAG: glycosyltransferase family 4 protein [Acidimicrobiales bacterium]
MLHLISDTSRRGAQVFACDLAGALDDLGVHGSVTALVHAGGPGLDVPVIGDHRFSPSGLTRLRRLMIEADVTVAHGSSTVLATAIAGARVRRPVVVRQIGQTAVWADTVSKRLRLTLALRRAAAVVALAPSAEASLRAVARVPAEKIVVIPNAVSVERHPPAPDADRDGIRRAARRSLGLDDRPVVVHVGALSPEKAVDDLLAAVAELDPMQVQLLLAGDGPDRTRLEALARTLEIDARFLGAIDDVPAVHAAADLAVLASRSESMPAALIEAGLAGLAVVATRVGAVSEIVRDGQTGLLVPPGDSHALAAAMRTLIDEAEIRQTMGIAARVHCNARFTLAQVAPRWAELLRSVASR